MILCWIASGKEGHLEPILAEQYMVEGLEKAFEGSNDLAEYLLLCSYEIHPTEKVCSMLGWFYGIHLGRQRDGFRFFRRAVRRNPFHGDVYNECGNLLLQSGSIRESVKWFHKSLQCKINPHKHYALYNLALVYKSWNRPERSIRYLNLALRFRPDFMKAKQLLLELQNDLLWREYTGAV